MKKVLILTAGFGEGHNAAARNLRDALEFISDEVKVEVLDEHKALLRPEMTGNVTIIQDERANVLTLPSSAILRQGIVDVLQVGGFAAEAGTVIDDLGSQLFGGCVEKDHAASARENGCQIG